MPIDEEVPAIRRRPPCPVAVLAFAVTIFVNAMKCLGRDKDWSSRHRPFNGAWERPSAAGHYMLLSGCLSVALANSPS